MNNLNDKFTITNDGTITYTGDKPINVEISMGAEHLGLTVEQAEKIMNARAELDPVKPQ